MTPKRAPSKAKLNAALTRLDLAKMRLLDARDNDGPPPKSDTASMTWVQIGIPTAKYRGTIRARVERLAKVDGGRLPRSRARSRPAGG